MTGPILDGVALASERINSHKLINVIAAEVYVKRDVFSILALMCIEKQEQTALAYFLFFLPVGAATDWSGVSGFG